MDFLAKDKNNIDTVIEVRFIAKDNSVAQLRRY
jgi:RecB family endonuclease NucS